VDSSELTGVPSSCTLEENKPRTSKGYVMQRYELYAGQIVMVEAPKAGKSLAKVIKVNPKNVKILLANGTRWNMHPTFIKRAATLDEVKEFGDTLGTGSTEEASLTLG